MSTLYDFNILGKVDASKTLITPTEFYIKLKEANAINDIDYEKFKKIMNGKSVIEPSKEWLEKEKDKEFQNVFKQLWPNLYDRMNPVEPAKKTEDLIAELEKRRIITSLIAQQDIERHKASLAKHDLTSNYANVYSSKFNDSLNICINGLNSGSPKIEISGPKPAENKKPAEPEKPKYPNIMSSYDSPYNTSKFSDRIVNSPYNPADLTKEAQLLKSIQESQEKLKLNQKIEKTTDLVDDIIEKVKVLQTEMKKKSAEIKLQNDLDKLKKEHKALHDLEHTHNHNHHHHHCHTRLSRSKERVRSALASYLTSDSSLERSPSPTRSKSSILKRPKANVSFNFESHHLKKDKSKSRKEKPKAKSYVGPKVNCWNCNCSHDKNVY